jgi:hypothetical protein
MRAESNPRLLWLCLITPVTHAFFGCASERMHEYEFRTERTRAESRKLKETSAPSTGLVIGWIRTNHNDRESVLGSAVVSQLIRYDW